MPNDLPQGVYDNLIDAYLQSGLDQLNDNVVRAAIKDIDPAEIPRKVAQAVQGWVERSLKHIPNETRHDVAVSVSRRLLQAIAEVAPDTLQDGDELTDPLRLLTAIDPVAPDGKVSNIDHPLTPIGDTVLMTNARNEPSVGHELLNEIDSADRIDLICAFIRWTGIRQLLDPLRRHVDKGRELRIITTTYTGSSEPRALEALQELGGQVRVSYDTGNTRLHAKAWMFHRNNGHTTVYIGSSNLTFSAQVTGLEWNVRVAQRTNPSLIGKFDATFASYWADPRFEAFDPERFQQAIESTKDDTIDLTPFDIRPYPFQRQILEKLQVERRRGHPHNLVVAATGTGKTIMAAMDYRAFKDALPQSRLLYVAHRREILDQSRTTFRHVLRDGAFGELWLGGSRPSKWDHVFASIQTLNQGDLESFPPDAFDIVIVDEFHHAAADSYEKLLNHIKPKHLLGLTATPERTDGLDILKWFGDRIAVELRLWDALEQELLSPFHYFGIHDGTDLSDVQWRRGGYDPAELTNILTADDFWAAKILQAVQDKIGAPQKMRALGFCVSMDHARFMAAQFERAGFRAKAIISDTPQGERQQALTDLRNGKIHIIFTVDLFNEGVDIPAVDVVLMLRPTESATIFLQQLGRGLRRADKKDVLTVLDFVGNQNKAFRFDLRYRQLLGRSRTELIRDIQDGFPYLPAGCHIELDTVTREIVLDNVRNALPTTWRRRIQELVSLGDVPLGTYLEQTGLEIEDVYRGNRYWTEIRRAAGHLATELPEGEKKLGRGIGRLLHIDDTERLEFQRKLTGSDQAPNIDQLSEPDQRHLQMALLTILNPRKSEFSSLQEAVDTLWSHPDLITEWSQLLGLMDDRIQHLHHPLEVPGEVPLQVHAQYGRDEILAAFGISTVTQPLPLQTGVYWHEQSQTDLLFITLQKSEKDYSPTTQYNDYAISETLFHWESQAATTVDSEMGQRYINHRSRGSRIALFIRTAKRDPNGRTFPYVCAGLANYVSHQSERPIAITWELEHSLPGDLFTAWRAAVA